MKTTALVSAATKGKRKEEGKQEGGGLGGGISTMRGQGRDGYRGGLGVKGVVDVAGGRG